MRTLPVIITSLLLALAAAQGPAAPPENADELLDEIVANLRGGGMRARLVLTVERGSSETRYELDVVSDGAERTLMQVVAPPRDAGQAFLSAGNGLFVYSPRLGRVLRLPPSGQNDAFLGSDISYADLAGDEFGSDYEANVLSRNEEELVLSLTPHANAPTPYGEIRLSAELPALIPRELVFFDQRETPVRRMTLEEIRELPGGQLFPTRMVVEDLTGSGGRTTAAYGEGEFGIEPPERCFTQQALERGCF